jgi:hypothetical protein
MRLGYVTSLNPKLSGSGQPEFIVHGAYTCIRICAHLMAIPIAQMYCWNVLWKATLIFPQLRMKSYGEPRQLRMVG